MGVDGKVMALRRTTLTRMATEVLEASVIAFGSLTLNQTMMPSAAAARSYLRGLRPRGKACLAFDSVGWGRGGAEAFHEQLSEMQFEILRDPLRVQFRPDEPAPAECREAGRLSAQWTIRRCAEEEGSG